MNVQYLVIFILVIVLVMAFVPRILFRRAMSQVIWIFRFHVATSPQSAKTAEQLGLGPPSIIQRMTSVRDYKPYAIQVLTHNEIIRSTEDGRLYLSEDALSASKFSKY